MCVSLLSFISQPTIDSKQPTLADPERVLYAALAPSPATSAVLKSACRTWEDHLWAQISIMCEEKLSSEIGRLGGFWEGGIGAIEKGLVPITKEEEQAEEEDWENEATNALDTLGGIGVIEGCVAAFMNLYTNLIVVLQTSCKSCIPCIAVEHYPGSHRSLVGGFCGWVARREPRSCSYRVSLPPSFHLHL